MDIQEFVKKQREIQKSLLDFIENENDNEENFQNLINILENQNIRDDRSGLKSFLYLIVKVSNNHYRTKDFFEKIEKILLSFTNEIKIFFSNLEIFKLFHSNKKILLFLISERIMFIDENISAILENEKYKNANYMEYFVEKNQSDDKNKKDENDDYICQLIKNDWIEEFITHYNTNFFSLNLTIKRSIFETHPFLLKNTKTKLIEYAAFFGSIQIFKYLYYNNAKKSKSLWLYAIHSDNPEILNFLEVSKIVPEDETYESCFKEAIKCHHNSIALYIKNNLLKETEQIFNRKKENCIECALHYYNYAFFPDDLSNKPIFNHLCKYDYLKLVEFFINAKKININEKIIRMIYFF
ncbi:hypothetical protein M9Y10_017937 [Tritrichomonas musculus]|uniref:DUF3447 domain-containing protein n=1 Tax=Tritrichomonas musculus TaxID=1915356 RepID=A0ABR2HWM6_9EUKA